MWFPGDYLVIPTNLVVKHDGTNVMGAGVALQAAKLNSGLPKVYGEHIKEWGSRLCIHENMICLPTKQHYKDDSTIDLVIQGVREMAWLFKSTPLGKGVRNIYLPEIGCGLGGLDWDYVRPRIDAVLDDRFVAVKYSE